MSDQTPSVADEPVPSQAGTDEQAVLDQLEADLAAVEQAIGTLDQVTSEGTGGDEAAAQIAAAVSTERFGAAEPDAPVG